MRVLMVGALALSLSAPALAQDDRPTAAQRAGVMKALRAAGYSNPASIERDDGGFEVDNARCKQGIRDIKLSASYKILSTEAQGHHGRGDDDHDGD